MNAEILIQAKMEQTQQLSRTIIMMERTYIPRRPYPCYCNTNYRALVLTLATLKMSMFQQNFL